MISPNGSTLWLIKLLIETRSGFDWTYRFFNQIHIDASSGEYDEELWIQRFRDTVEKNFTDAILDEKSGFFKVKPSDIDWYQLYIHCFEQTKPAQK